MSELRGLVQRLDFSCIGREHLHIQVEDLWPKRGPSLRRRQLKIAVPPRPAGRFTPWPVGEDRAFLARVMTWSRSHNYCIVWLKEPFDQGLSFPFHVCTQKEASQRGSRGSSAGLPSLSLWSPQLRAGPRSTPGSPLRSHCTGRAREVMRQPRGPQEPIPPFALPPFVEVNPRTVHPGNTAKRL